MSMRRSVDQIRTTHTGSLPRPPDMLETLHQLAAGHSIDLAAYESALTWHVADIVKRQVEARINTVSDGECSKPSFQHYVAERLAGFEPRMPEGGLPVPTGPMGLDGRDALMFPDFIAMCSSTTRSAIRSGWPRASASARSGTSGTTNCGATSRI